MSACRSGSEKRHGKDEAPKMFQWFEECLKFGRLDVGFKSTSAFGDLALVMLETASPPPTFLGRYLGTEATR